MTLYTTLLVGFSTFDMFRLNEILPFNNDGSTQYGAQSGFKHSNHTKNTSTTTQSRLFFCYTVNNYSWIVNIPLKK